MSQLQSFSFDPPESGKVDLLIIAGEHSGDEHAAKMVKQALARNPDLKIAALGGVKLQEEGVQLLFDLTQYSVIGFFEVLKHLKEFKALFAEVLRWIRTHQPEAVCFVDYPGMNLRLAKELEKEKLNAKSRGPIKLLYYISPQVWVWKAKRRFSMARMLDSLAVIFPFEVETFDDTSLETKFVGHPFLAQDYELPTQYDPDGPVLLLPGSRQAAIDRIAPVMFAAFAKLLKRKDKLKAVCIYANDTLKSQLEGILAKHPELEGHVSFQPNSATVGASCVLTSSGTMSLNCALANIPGVIVYRLSSLTYLLGRLLAKVQYIGIANLLLKEALYPEYIQRAAKPDALAAELIECMENPDRIKKTIHLSAKLRETLDKPREGGAGKWLIDNLAK